MITEGSYILIFVMDVDGTICFNGQFIEDNLKREIKRIGEKHQIIFASARPIRDLVPVVKDFGNKILIGGNGSIVSINEEIGVIQSIAHDVFLKLKELIVSNHLEYIIDGPFDYSAKVSPDNKIYRQLDPERLAQNVKMDDITEPIKVILLNLDDDMFEHITKALAPYSAFLSINYHKRENNIDITAKNVNKYNTLKQIIHMASYVAYGNDINDYDLLKHAKQAYYVGGNKAEMPFANVEYIDRSALELIKSLKKY